VEDAHSASTATANTATKASHLRQVQVTLTPTRLLNRVHTHATSMAIKTSKISPVVTVASPPGIAALGL
jgi:hypothetical protein